MSRDVQEKEEIQRLGVKENCSGRVGVMWRHPVGSLGFERIVDNKNYDLTKKEKWLWWRIMQCHRNTVVCAFKLLKEVKLSITPSFYLLVHWGKRWAMSWIMLSVALDFSSSEIFERSKGGGGERHFVVLHWSVGSGLYCRFAAERFSGHLSLSSVNTSSLAPTTVSMLYCFIHFLRILLCYPPPPPLQHSSQDQWLIRRYLPITDCNQPLEADFLGFPFIFLLIHSLFTLRCSITTFCVCVFKCVQHR